MLIEGISLSASTKNHSVLRTPDGRHLRLNQASTTLIRLLQENPHPEAATRAFNQHFHTHLHTSDFHQLIQHKLAGYGILATDANHPKRKTSRYLSFQIPFFSPTVAGILATPFRPLFKPPLFTALFSLLMVVMLGGLASYAQATLVWASIHWFLLACLVYPSALIHELGHVAACRTAGISHGPIGFGFYLIFPVLYADVSQVWQASKKQRIIVNLAGVTNELFYATCLLSIYYFSTELTFLLAFYLILFKVLFELNPFARMDGYWLFSDMTNTPNLLAKANGRIKEVFTYLFVPSKRRGISFHRTENWLLLYGIMNILFIFIYAGVMLNREAELIVRFPKIVIDLLLKTVQLDITVDAFKREYFFVAIFYWLVGSFLYKLIKKLYRASKLNRRTSDVYRTSSG